MLATMRLLRRLVPPSPLPSVRRSLYIDANKERELFSVTTKRWLYNDEKQRAVRHVPFNIQAFLDVAIRSAGANECITFEKIQDGTMNRVFSLKFDNGVEFVAKIPFPVAGPKHFCTASEVATLDYLRTEHGIPVPEVRAWCSRADSTPVGAEFIMYGKIPGVQLYQHDETELPLESDPFVSILPVIQLIESRLSNTRFSQIGSIYYKEDVSEYLRDRPLYAQDTTPKSNSVRFCIGPTTDREFWRAGRANLNIDRGPWSDVRSYSFALGNCARLSIDAHSDPATHDAHYHLISDYEKLIPHIAPKHSSYILWHPDLHASNILITDTPPPCKLTGIIDWQGATVAPYYLQLDIPPAYTAEEHALVNPTHEDGPELSSDVNDLDDEQQRRARLAHRHALRQRLHEIFMCDQDPELAEELHGDMGAQAKRIVSSPLASITRGTTEGLAFIRYSFLTCRVLWSAAVGVDEDHAPLVSFPIEINDADESQIKEEWLTIRRDASMCNELLQHLGIPLDGEGIVDAGQYEAAKHAVEGAKLAAMDGASSEHEKDRIANVWPLQDGKVSLTAESCY